MLWDGGDRCKQSKCGLVQSSPVVSKLISSTEGSAVAAGAATCLGPNLLFHSPTWHFHKQAVFLSIGHDQTSAFYHVEKNIVFSLVFPDCGKDRLSLFLMTGWMGPLIKIRPRGLWNTTPSHLCIYPASIPRDEPMPGIST